jgi:hypothetical protein
MHEDILDGGGRHVIPLILNLSARRSWLVDLVLRPPYPKKNSGTHSVRGFHYICVDIRCVQKVAVHAYKGVWSDDHDRLYRPEPV